jgi:ABC-2 type transport system permease protein
MIHLLDEVDESRVFQRLRSQTLMTHLSQLIATSRLRVCLAIVMSAIFWVAMFAVMYEGFTFLENEAGAFTLYTVEKIFNLFYASLMVMLVFSSALILYGGIYRSREADFLLTTPARHARIFGYKFQEAILLSSWGFILLGSPMLIAYGVVAKADWHYFVLLGPYIVTFVFIPSGVGAIACMLIVYHLTKVRKPLTVIGGLFVLGAATWAGWTVVFGQQNDLLTPEWFEEMMVRLSATENRWFPSWWLSSGLLEAARTDGNSQPWAQSLLFFALLLSNALFLHFIAVRTAKRYYQASFSRLHTERSRGRISQVSWIDLAVARAMIFVPLKVRLLLVKDLRIFRRDPVQWAQFLIFFGLVALYFLNMKSLRYSTPFIGWVNVVSFLNLTVVGLILSTFTTRFIFPMISLEGRRFWILGLLPLPRETILRGKYAFAVICCWIPSSALVLTSDLLLGIAPRIILVHQLTCLILCSGLSAIAVGLGARMPDLCETNPSKIAAGFGGTLNLVISAIYILLIVGLTAVPSHLNEIAVQRQWDVDWMRAAKTSGILAAVLIGIACTMLPLQMGYRAFRRMEV